eukprot:c14407_g2_i1 orf=2-1015(-)
MGTCSTFSLTLEWEAMGHRCILHLHVAESHSSSDVELNLHMDTYIFTLERGFLNYGQIPIANFQSEKGLWYRARIANFPSEKGLCHRARTRKCSLTLIGGIRRNEHVDISGSMLELAAIGHGHIPKHSSEACFRMEASVAHETTAKPSSQNLDIIKSEKMHKAFDNDILSMQDAMVMAALEQEADVFCIDVFVSMIKKSREAKNLEYAKTVHLHVCAAGLDKLETPGNHLVPMFVECGSISYAQQAFYKIALLSEHSWTYLMQGYIACAKSDLALNIFQVMREDSSVAPSKYTYVALLKACAKIKDLQRGQEVHVEVVMKGMEDDLFIGNVLVDMYAK